jgi:hypothetical protein
MTVLIKNKLIQGGEVTGYTVSIDGKESVYSVRDAVHLVYTADSSNVFIVRNKHSRLRMNDRHIKASLNNSHLRAKTGRLAIVTLSE